MPRAEADSPARERPIGHLEKLRSAELQSASAWLRPGLSVLELGAGSGYQAGLISALGCKVFAIDLAGRPQLGPPYFPVHEYDGVRIPAEDNSYDVVFSANVLEHVPRRATGAPDGHDSRRRAGSNGGRGTLATLLAETLRVLRPTGVAVHIVPSASWRLWTSATLFISAARWGLGQARADPRVVYPAPSIRDLGSGSIATKVGRIVKFPLTPHGEMGSSFAELYFYRRARWVRCFEANNFEVTHAAGTGVFYTGFCVAPGLPMDRRMRMSQLLGSSSHIFVLRARRFDQ
jgi:SAM-dependent methyltransferase